MTHLQGQQDPNLFNTANFIVNNPDEFNERVVVWSQSFIDGGISDLTYEEIIRRAGVSITPVTSFGDVITQEPSLSAIALDEQQSQQITELGLASVQISEALAATQAQLQVAIDANREFVTEVNQRLSSDVIVLGASITDASNAATQGGLTSFLGGIGTGGLIALAVVAFFVLRGKI